MPWAQVDVPVLNARAGATLVITTTHTYWADPATSAGTGWTCSAPSFLLDATLLVADSTLSCSYDAADDVGATLRLDYRVASGAALTAVLTPAPDDPDAAVGELVAHLALRP